MSAYFQTELQYGAIYGPFPFKCHISAFLTRDKPNSDKKIVILDLSYPPGRSVNDGVPKDKYLDSYFQLKYPSIDDIVDSLKQFGSDALLYKIDISHAFRHPRIDPVDIDLLGLKHDSYYVDGTLLFGFRHGPVFFSTVLTQCSLLCKTHSIIELVLLYLSGDMYQSYHTLIALLQELGLEISTSKLIEPSAICLGIEINSLNRTLRIPDDKLKEIQQI